MVGATLKVSVCTPGYRDSLGSTRMYDNYVGGEGPPPPPLRLLYETLHIWKCNLYYELIVRTVNQ